MKAAWEKLCGLALAALVFVEKRFRTLLKPPAAATMPAAV